MPSRPSSSRRTFLSRIGLSVASGTMIGGAGVPVSAGAGLKHELRLNGADLGTLFAEVDRITGQPNYAYSFLSDRFSDFSTFTKTARAKVFELLRYRPTKVDPRPEILERLDQGQYYREKVLFSIAPEIRLPA